MANFTNHSQRPVAPGALLEPSWAHAGAGVYSAIVFLIVTGLYFDVFDITLQLLARCYPCMLGV